MTNPGAVPLAEPPLAPPGTQRGHGVAVLLTPRAPWVSPGLHPMAAPAGGVARLGAWLCAPRAALEANHCAEGAWSVRSGRDSRLRGRGQGVLGRVCTGSGRGHRRRGRGLARGGVAGSGAHRSSAERIGAERHRRSPNPTALSAPKPAPFRPSEQPRPGVGSASAVKLCWRPLRAW